MAGTRRKSRQPPDDFLGGLTRVAPGDVRCASVYEHLTIEQRDGVAVVRIDRPPANALDAQLLDEGHRCLQELAEGPPGPVVLTGREQFFSAGMDLRVVPTLTAQEQREVVTGINRLFASWYGLERPVVAAVNGHAIAGGLILALCADYRVGTTGPGRLGLTELKAGIPYPAVAMAVVRAELTPPVARDLILRARLVDSDEAQSLGVLDELVDGDPVPRALQIAQELAALPQAAYAQIKYQLRGDTIAATRAVLSDESDPLLRGWLGDETRDASASALGG